MQLYLSELWERPSAVDRAAMTQYGASHAVSHVLKDPIGGAWAQCKILNS